MHVVGNHLAPQIAKKGRLGPQNNPKSSRPEKTAKNSKLPKLPEKCFEQVRKGGWPPISTWITKVTSNVIQGAKYSEFRACKPYKGCILKS